MGRELFEILEIIKTYIFSLKYAWDNIGKGKDVGVVGEIHIIKYDYFQIFYISPPI
jgi:hypothetical protein